MKADGWKAGLFQLSPEVWGHIVRSNGRTIRMDTYITAIEIGISKQLLVLFLLSLDRLQICPHISCKRQYPIARGGFGVV